MDEVEVQVRITRLLLLVVVILRIIIVARAVLQILFNLSILCAQILRLQELQIRTTDRGPISLGICDKMR